LKETSISLLTSVFVICVPLEGLGVRPRTPSFSLMPPAIRRRRLHRGQVEEDAAQLKLGISPLNPQLMFLGSEFEDADTLTTSEAKLLIDAVLTQRAKETGGEEMPLTEFSTP
jgi:hypothetical protein